jgi:VWFA-related protein
MRTAAGPGALSCLVVALLLAGPAGAMPATPVTHIHYDPATRIVTLQLPLQGGALQLQEDPHPGNFAVYENGVRQHPVNVQVEHTPITVGVLMEYGGRLPALDDAAGSAVSMAVEQLLSDIGPRDHLAIWTYGDHLQTLAGFSQSHQTLESTLIGLQSPPSSELNFYDALVAALGRLRGRSGQRALLVISSGRDTFSRTSYPQALQAAAASGIPIYAIDLGPVLQRYISDAATPNPYGALNLVRDQTRLRKLAAASGGRCYSPEDILDLSGLYDDVMERLRVHYRISYRSDSPVGRGADGVSRLRRVLVVLVRERHEPRRLEDAAAAQRRHAPLIATVSYRPYRPSGHAAHAGNGGPAG